MISTNHRSLALGLLASLVLASACGGGEVTGDASSTTGASTTDASSTGAGGTMGLTGCDGDRLLENPTDTSAPGPSEVGVKTVTISGLTAEVWYPAAPGSTAGVAPVDYDVRQWLPPSEDGKISDAKAPHQSCNCFRDVGLDEAHGPYPVVIFVHGTAGFRTQSLELMTHWASRGFVVIAADHPGLDLTDLIASICGGGATPQDLEGDLGKLVAAVGAPADDLAFLAGHVDPTRLAMTGHSAGGEAVADQGSVAEVVIPMAAGGVSAGAALRSKLVLGAKEDKVVPFENQASGYDASPSPKRLVALSPAGHLAFSNLCGIQNADGEDIVTIGMNADVCGLSLAGALFDCDPSYVSEAVGTAIVEDASSAVLEETLQCSPERAAWLDAIQTRHPEVAELEQSTR